MQFLKWIPLQRRRQNLSDLMNRWYWPRSSTRRTTPWHQTLINWHVASYEEFRNRQVNELLLILAYVPQKILICYPQEGKMIRVYGGLPDRLLPDPG
jgi:hypothetical protein